jgi:hypothetical protein
MFRPAGGTGKHGLVSLRGNPISEPATLPDGRRVEITVGVADDPYIGTDTDTIALELREGEEVLASLLTVLRLDQDSEARALAREIRAGLESGSLEPTAGALEPLVAAPR